MNIDYKIYVIFPNSRKSLCEIITQHIIELFGNTICCEGITYSLNNIDIKKINKILQDKCILIIGYEGNISYENCYKLGMAHAKDRIVILINILPKDDYIFKENPEYIRKHFFVAFQVNKKELERITKTLEDIINVILINDFSSILYLKAIHLCNDLEVETKITITKLDKNLFESRLSKYEEYFLKQHQKKLFDLYLEDDKSLYITLLYCICEDKYQLLEIEDKANIQQQSLPMGNDLSKQEILENFLISITNNYNIQQYGKGDNFGGDNIDGDKIIG
ncbi:hypothetical protein H6G41_09300 [Tolypothrix sp. FACHB-123]|uniref:hypothetical protein n=1 Tax=Tolypothrix sp. FACHB-123 TaxID=2692868 RepID=UPI001683C01D|nr:hypothetical protein [Tolypothrix sp. FACHB-123]MBD2354819.1 hypothetical protein [Tolypothrix sp. FACHB-123]